MSSFALHATMCAANVGLFVYLNSTGLYGRSFRSTGAATASLGRSFTVALGLRGGAGDATGAGIGLATGLVLNISGRAPRKPGVAGEG
jgi:hypothetical protein